MHVSVVIRWWDYKETLNTLSEMRQIIGDLLEIRVGP